MNTITKRLMADEPPTPAQLRYIHKMSRKLRYGYRKPKSKLAASRLIKHFKRSEEALRRERTKTAIAEMKAGAKVPGMKPITFGYLPCPQCEEGHDRRESCPTDKPGDVDTRCGDVDTR
jgi:hypothetical protein